MMEKTMTHSRGLPPFDDASPFDSPITGEPSMAKVPTKVFILPPELTLPEAPKPPKTKTEAAAYHKSNAKTGSPNLPFKEVEASLDPVNPALMLSEIASTIRRFIVLEDHKADAVALWVVLTHVSEAVDICPILIINAPERACAKTLLQELVASMSNRPLVAANVTASVVFRAIEEWGVSFFIDEADTFFKKNTDMHGLINSGYKKGTPVLRNEVKGDSFEPRTYSVYGPKSLAGIALELHLPDATMSRGVVINMRRKLPHEKVDRMRSAEPGLFDQIASKIARFALDYADQIRAARPHLPEELSDRSQDNWEPLLAIAECAGPEWVARATAAALTLAASSEMAAGTGNELLADIQAIFESKGLDRLRTTDLIQELTANEEMSWATYNRGKPLSPRDLAKLLGVYNIHPKTVRHGNQTPKGYDLDQFAGAFARYLGAPEKLPQQQNSALEESAEVPASAPEPTVPDLLADLDLQADIHALTNPGQVPDRATNSTEDSVY